MKIACWNVAGIRAIIKKGKLDEFAGDNNPDIICIQETKALESEVVLSEELKEMYPYRYWNSNSGLVQRKGLSGVAIFSRIQPEILLSKPEFDNEGRILSLTFKTDKLEFVLVTTYVPNSQSMASTRYNFRNEWNDKFNKYLESLGDKLIVCGDMNVAHQAIDICNPQQKYNKIPGFFNCERQNMSNMLQAGFVDIYRLLNENGRSSTYWSHMLKQPRSAENGWRIDYFLVKKELLMFIESNKLKYNFECCKEQYGSDHCPIILTIE